MVETHPSREVCISISHADVVIDTPIAVSDTKLDEKMNSSSVSLPEGIKAPSNEDVVEEVSERRKRIG